MTPDKGSEALTPADHRFVQEEFAPVAEGVAKQFFGKAVAVARAEGWQQDLAEAIATFGTAALIEALLDGTAADAAIELAMKKGRRQVLGGIFRGEVEAGRDRHAAFRRLLELHRENAARIGSQEDACPEAWLVEALAAIDAAAAQDLPLEEQMMAGYLSLARSAQTVIVDNALGYN